MDTLLRCVFLLLDIAPQNRIGGFLRPVLIIAVVIVAAVILIKTLIGRKKKQNRQPVPSDRGAASEQKTANEKNE